MLNLTLAAVLGLLIVVCLVVSWRRADNIVTLSKEPPGCTLYTAIALSWLSGVFMLYVVQVLISSIHDLIMPGK